MTQTHLDIDLDTIQVLLTRGETDAEIGVDMPGVEIGIPGPQGPPGPTGLIKVNHGADPNVARPDAPLVYWVGSVQPNNGFPDDLLLLKEP